MRVLVTGACGQLGHDVLKVLNQMEIQALGTSKIDFDLTDSDAVRNFVENFRPDAIIHCAAYTDVDRAEDDADLCRKVNVDGTKILAKICGEIKAKMVYLSTDYVFPGTGEMPYETDDPKGPLNIYGRTKLAGEKAVRDYMEKYFIIRTSWVFGKKGKDFVKAMLSLEADHSEVNVVRDQIGSPTYTADLAPLLCGMILTDKYGTYHATNEGYCSWADFAEEIFLQTACRTKVIPIASSEYPSRATRPLNSKLSKTSLDAAGFSRLPAWQDALHRYLMEIIG